MDLAGLDTAAIARSLAQVADRAGDFADAYFERSEMVELDEGDLVPQFAVRREEGVALRLVRDGRSWLASRDRIDRDSFGNALRQVARAVPQAPYPLPEFELAEPPPSAELEALLSFPTRVTRRLRRDHIAFPLRLAVRRHRRVVRWVGTRVAAEPQRERFHSVKVHTPWGRWGRLFLELDDTAVEELASSLLARFHAREAAPPDVESGPFLLAPAAVAVLVHEAVAHALESDTLAATGRLRAELDRSFGEGPLSVLDDPTTAPEGVRRAYDDDGVATVRRWLLQQGKVRQPLADLATVSNSEELQPGAGRRSSRHQAPRPRSTHLEVVPGESGPAELLEAADGGLWIAEVDRGRLDPFTGRFRLHVPTARWVDSGQTDAPTGAFTLGGSVAELGGLVRAVGSHVAFSGAGWCAKGGVRLPVWATTPALLLEGLEVVP